MTRLRSAMLELFYYALTYLMMGGTLIVRLIRPSFMHQYATWWCAGVIWSARVIGGMRFRVVGLEHVPTLGPALIAMEHQAAIDTLVWFGLVPHATYVMKRELTRVPLFGQALLLAGMIPVDRDGGAAALKEMLRAVDAAVADQRQIIIFPQGTRTPPGTRVPLKAGVVAIAQRSRLPVIPVATNSGLCWRSGVLRKRAGTIDLVIGAPIPPETPRRDLLARIEAAWIDASRHFTTPA